jgi:hypothetical protein
MDVLAAYECEQDAAAQEPRHGEPEVARDNSEDRVAILPESGNDLENPPNASPLASPLLASFQVSVPEQEEQVVEVAR